MLLEEFSGARRGKPELDERPLLELPLLDPEFDLPLLDPVTDLNEPSPSGRPRG